MRRQETISLQSRTVHSPEIDLVPAKIFASPGFGPPRVDATNRSYLSQYLWIVKRHRWKLLAFIAFSVIATVIISKRLTPLYESTAVIDVDRQTPSAVLGDTTTAAASAEDMQNFLATQERIIQSDAVLRPVVEKYHLMTKTLDKLKKDKILSSRLKDAPIELPGLKITQPPHTFLILISYRSPDPQLSADIANEIANSYIRHTYDIRFQAASQLTDYMEKQLTELKAKMEQSASALAQFEKDLNVINPEAKTDVFSARLMQLNNDLTAAEADRASKEAAYNAVKGGSMEAVEASEQGEQLRLLEGRLNEAQEKFAEVQTQFGPAHPAYKKAASQVKELQQQIDQLRDNIVQRVQTAYLQAVNKEALLQKDMLQAKAEFDQMNSKSFEYKALKQEADTDKELYEQLIKKIREAGINASFESSSIRLADIARPALYPSFPKTKLNAVIALFGSTIIGLGIIFLMDAMNTVVFDSETLHRELHIPQLPSLPVGKFSPSTQPMQEFIEPGLTKVETNGSGGIENSTFHEAIRTLRSSILLAGGLEQRPRSLLITSPSPAEGKSTVALYLAVAHSQQQRKTLLIDGDLRRPANKLGLPRDRGLSDVVNGTLSWHEAVQTPEGYPDLDVLSAGPASRLVADRVGIVMRSILEEAEREYDLVVIDSPPLLGFAEPLELASIVDSVVVIARAGRTTRSAIASAIGQLRQVHANIMGVVLNGIRADMSSKYYYYTTQYYSHYAKQD
ncbi:MAG TPA: polysaccharide biosynthesis tyrosine autokinase [Pseudacidobacterium sp.]|nr:polysaccharide biosynthesis tyrosine autokinase [Pseudacidobacterium sp.]